jgi:hypothetical protein
MKRSHRYDGIYAALPDAITAAAFVLVWASPFVFGPLSVKTAMLTMLVEFFLVHATGFFTAFGSDRMASRTQRIGMLLGLSLFYVLMIGAFALSFHAWWPLLSFGWLLIGKVVWVVQNPKPDDDSTFRQMAAWAGSVALFLGGCAFTVIADIPRWGMSKDLGNFGLNAEGGLWESEPHRVVAFGVIYFGVTFLVKLGIGLYRAGARGAASERFDRHAE